MPRVFSLGAPTYDIPGVDHLELEWAGAAHEELARQIGFQEQFRCLFRDVFLSLQSVPQEHPDWRATPLSLSARAGAIKAYVLITVSIAEAALAALGEERHLGRRRGELFQRTFGSLLQAWQTDDGPHPDVADIWQELQLLKRHRNAVHLNRATQEQITWQETLRLEPQLLAAAERVVDRLRELSHVFRNHD